MDVNLVFAISFAVLMFIIGTIFIIQSIIRKRTAYVLTIAMFIGSLASIIEAVRLSTIPLPIHNRVNMLYPHLIMWQIMYILALIFFIQLDQEKILNVIFLISIILFTIHVSFGALWLYTSSLPDNIARAVTLVWDISYEGQGILVFGFGAYVHFLVYYKTKEIEGTITGGALAFLVIGFIIGLINDFHVKIFPFIGAILKTVGILIFVIFYLVKIDYIFRLPFNISSVMLFNRLGMVIYSASYITEKSNDSAEKAGKDAKGAYKEPQMELITAAINAFSSFMKETTGSEQPLQRIKTGDKLLILEQGDLCSISLITTQSSYFMLKSMKKMVHLMEERYSEELNLNYMDSKYFADIPKIIQEVFPYLSLPSFEIF